MDIKVIIDMLIERQGLLKDADSFKIKMLDDVFLTQEVLSDEMPKKVNSIYQFEATNDMSDIENYLIFDIRKKESIAQFEKFCQCLYEKNGLFYIPVMIFCDWEQEVSRYKEIVSRCKDAKSKKRIKAIFDSKIALYTEVNKPICIYIDNSVNYLEYFADNPVEYLRMKGFVYNISFYELKKIFNVTGIDLFKKNVRKGVASDKTIIRIKNEFKKYIYVSLYNNLVNENNDEYLREVLGINDDILQNNNPRRFWFCHNGITIFSYDKIDFKRIDNKLFLNPKKISVINGAQTLTSFFGLMNELKDEMLETLQDMDVSSDYIVDCIENSAKDIYLKTIIIYGYESFVESITYGLNTQVPVLNEHILANSQETKDLNKILKKDQMAIVRPGEITPFRYNYDILEFAKKYLLCKNEPGRSKNLRKSQLKEILENAKQDFLMNENKYLNDFMKLNYIDEWWQSYRKERENIYSGNFELTLNKYGKNYFSSYILNNEFNENDYFLLFDRFVESMKRLMNPNQVLSSNDLKKDELFKKYLQNKQFLTEQNKCCGNIDCEELLSFLQENINSNYSISTTISRYLSQKNILLERFRVVNRISDKCCEAFPFPRSTFSEIYQSNPNFDERNYVSFEKSLLRKFVGENFSLFVLEHINTDGLKKLIKVHYIPCFSFIGYMSDIKHVFNQTILAFQKGDEKLFPKVSDNMKFHIRPKAMNSDDTFEFSNGNSITKKTFWANKDVLNEMIDNYINKK